MPEPRTHELGLFNASIKRVQPRDQSGRFVRVQYSPERLKVMELCRNMRGALGVAPSPWLNPFGSKEGETE